MKGYIRVNQGKPKRMIKLAYDTSHDRASYIVTDVESEGGVDYQHEVIAEHRGLFFFPPDNIDTTGKHLYICGTDLDVVIKTEKIRERLYKCTYESGREFMSMFSHGRLHPPRVREIRSHVFTVPEVFLVGDGTCVICRLPISKDQLESLECGHHFHANCLTGSVKFSFDDICCPLCWRRSL